MGQFILNEYERNGYHDSDFFVVYLDTDTNTVETKLYGTTRACVGEDIRKDMLPASAEHFTKAKEILVKARRAAEAANKERALEMGAIHVGDTVEVVRGRKYPKGSTFIVTREKEVTDCYGRKVATYLCGDGFYLNKANCELVEQGNHYDRLASSTNFPCLTQR